MCAIIIPYKMHTASCLYAKFVIIKAQILTMKKSKKETKELFYVGIRHGIPIGIGYFAVAFSLGIAARAAGLNVIQATLASLLCNASAGEYAGFTIIAAGASYFEMIPITLIANARYILMGCAMSQRFAPNCKTRHRLAVGFDMTDELFAIIMARPGHIEPAYAYGAMCASVPMWAAGTALGAAAGSILPEFIVTALGLALYGMFLAIIIPPARRERVIGAIVAVSFAASLAMSRLPRVSEISEGTRTVILTVIIASAAALICPRRDEDDDDNTADEKDLLGDAADGT